MRKLLMGSALAMAVTAASPAVAVVPTIIFTQGDFSLPSYTTATVYQSFDSGADGATYVPAAGESTTGTVRTYTGTIPNVTADPTPAPDNSPYLSVQGNRDPALTSTYTTTFTSPQQVFSFIFGSLDSFNTLKLTFADSTSLLLTGAQVVNGPLASIGPFNSTVAGRVTYDVGGASGITSATFGSSQQAFEIDGLAAAVPEASTWSMMLLGLGLVGGQLRIRSRRAMGRVAAA